MRGRATERIFCAIGLVPVILLLAWGCAFALDPSLDVSQYAHTAWKIRDGFTRGTIVLIAQTPDGYLWLGTESGLFRFDGVRAVPWPPPDSEQLPGNFISGLVVAHDGTLWIGTLKGLASYKDGKLTQYPELAGANLGLLLEDREQIVWFGVRQAAMGRLCAMRDKKINCYGSGTFGLWANPLYEDHKGNLWVTSATGLWRWAPGPPERFAFPHGVTAVVAAAEDDSGTLLLGTTDGLKQLVAGKIKNYALPGISGHSTISNLFRSLDGSLWMGTHEGLLHLHQGRVDRFSLIDGLSGDSVARIFEDREGSVWVATTDGLDRFRDYAVPTISRNQGLSTPAAALVQATSDRSIWTGAGEGLNRWANARVTFYRGKSALSENRAGDETKLSVSRAANEIANSGLIGTVYSLGRDDEGRLWVATDKGLFYFERDRFVSVSGVHGGYTFSITGDGHGGVWILQPENLFHWSPNAAVQQIPWSQFGHKTGRTMLPDYDPGSLWLGFYEGGLVYLKDGKVVRSYGAGVGLGDGRVNHVRFGPNGGLWASTEGGLSRIKDEHIATLTQKNGLPCDEVHWSMEDAEHDVWLYMPCGLVRIARSELDAWINDPQHLLKTTVFDNSDGLRSVGVYGAAGAHVTQSPDGRIWFAPRDGLSVIDPRHLPFNKLPPPVHIEEIVANHKSYPVTSDANGNVRLPPGIRDLQIDYTALSLVAPEKVFFRYKLEGWDRDWQDAGTRRQAFYNNLPPRNYHFRVMACNNSGVWNEAGTFLNFSVAPAYYQTNWFRALCAAAFLAVLWGLHRVRVGQLRAQEEKFRETIESIPTMAFVSLPDGYRTFVNKGWVEYTGMTVEQSLGSGWHAVIHPEDLKRVLGEWEAALSSERPMYYEARYRRAEDGQYRWFMVRVVPQRNKRGKLVKWFGTVTDIEDRKRAEQEREKLRQLEADLAHINRVSMLGEMAASLAHEIKQPIAAAINSANSCIEWLAHEPPNLDRARASATRIDKYGNRAAEIIDRIQSLYKKSPSQRELVEVNGIIEEILRLLKGEANRYSIAMRTELAAELPKIMVDRVQLQQVFMNLMLNAIEAMKDLGGELTVNSQLQDGQFQFSVSDTGVGLPKEKMDQIFSAFFTTKPQGSGMGLSISRSIVESHGGRLWATANDGRGATFHFTLPTVAEVHDSVGSGDRAGSGEGSLLPPVV
ncbi:MAG TPA: ATP-binding protein [Candidatus Acidoferrales bacterium]|nr:ATP-binding protein [Candidatus Acidoferrales bacterium]